MNKTTVIIRFETQFAAIIQRGITRIITKKVKGGTGPR
jgi:hypothetical protein